MEVICNLYKRTTGKWYGEHTFMFYSVMDLPKPELIIEECGKSYTHPNEFIIHVQYKNMTWLVL